MSMKTEAETTFKVLDSYAFSENYEDFFAFSRKSTVDKLKGWEIYNDMAEYKRMGLNLNEKVI